MAVAFRIATEVRRRRGAAASSRSGVVAFDAFDRDGRLQRSVPPHQQPGTVAIEPDQPDRPEPERSLRGPILAQRLKQAQIVTTPRRMTARESLAPPRLRLAKMLVDLPGDAVAGEDPPWPASTIARSSGIVGQDVVVA